MIFFATSQSFLVVYLVMSLLTFALYDKDKQAAIRGGWRTKESTLHMFSLFGGWPGALIAQHRLRHKTKKQPFKTIMSITIVGNILAFCETLTPQGQAIVQPVLAKVLSLL